MRMYDIVPLVAATSVVILAIIYDFWIKPKINKVDGEQSAVDSNKKNT